MDDIDREVAEVLAGLLHVGLRPYRTHKTYTPRCRCGWEGTPVPHGEKHNQFDAHRERHT